LTVRTRTVPDDGQIAHGAERVSYPVHMEAGQVRRQDATPMRSLVNWALLGLVIDRPSYAYELAQRFERTFGDTLTLSSISHVYTALGTLKERELIEEMPGTREGRQPKPHYRATEQGVAAYQQWLTGQIAEDRQRQRLFVLALGTLTRHRQAALEILARYEQACLDEARQGTLPPSSDGTGEHGVELVGALIGEESRLAIGARLSWARYAREVLSAHAQPPARP
jgi:DNA-binding PadR family transcriptional regulator